MLDKILSNYCFQNIFNYIGDENIKYNLFNHSKHYQNKLNLEILDYQQKYFYKLGLHLDNYFDISEEEESENFDKENLIKKLRNDLSNINVDSKIISVYLVNYITKYKQILLNKYNEQKKL